MKTGQLELQEGHMKKTNEEARCVKSNISTSVKTQVRGSIVILRNPDGNKEMLRLYANAYAGYSN